MADGRGEKCCRNCRFFEHGSCVNKIESEFEFNIENTLDEIFEDGLISGAIREAAADIDENEVEDIDEAISVVLKNNLLTRYSFNPVTPSRFYCSLWD